MRKNAFAVLGSLQRSPRLSCWIFLEVEGKEWKKEGERKKEMEERGGAARLGGRLLPGAEGVDAPVYFRSLLFSKFVLCSVVCPVYFVCHIYNK